MKRIVFLIMLLFTITACGTIISKPNSYGRLSDGIVIDYRFANSASPEAIYDEVILYNTKEVVYSSSNQDGFRSVTLSDEDYQKILDLAFTDEIMSLNGKTFNPNENDRYEVLNLYYDDIKQITIDGYDIDNENFVSIKKLLLNY